MAWQARLRWSLSAALLVGTAGAAYPWPSWLKHSIFSADYNGYANAKLNTLIAFGKYHKDGLGAGPIAGLTEMANDQFLGTTSDPGSAYVLYRLDDRYQFVAYGLKDLAQGTSTPLVPLPSGIGVGTEPNDVYLLVTDGNKTQKIILYRFTGGIGGSAPLSGLTLGPDRVLYGTASGGQYGHGLVYQLTPRGDGTYKQSVLHAFASALEGEVPGGGLVSDSKGRLYGATKFGGAASCSYAHADSGTGCGVLYRLTPPAPGGGTWTESVLHNFAGGADGAGPGDVIIDKKGDLFGATIAGGQAKDGTIYEAQTTSKGATYTWSVLWNFTGGTDGKSPTTKLALDSGGALYGTAQGGAHGLGNVYILIPPYLTYDWQFQVMHSFAGTDGSQPSGGLALDKAGTIFGVTTYGGTNGGGTAYKLTP